MEETDRRLLRGDLTPRQIVAELDKYIIGQAEAKRSVAIALRNRHRRRALGAELRDEVAPKNILMIGPTGVGKTEIARRIARLAGAPFVKVEATKFTEVGYVGRDVDSMVRDLVEAALRLTRAESAREVAGAAEERTVERLLDALVPLPGDGAPQRHPLAALLGGAPPDEEEALQRRRQAVRAQREAMRQHLLAGEMEGELIEIEVVALPVTPSGLFAGPEGMGALGGEAGMADMLGQLLPRRRHRRLSVAEARRVLHEQETSQLIDQERAVQQAVARAEDGGIIFIDELDKIAARDGVGSADVSREGVQRDLLPIVEGSTVTTRYGPVKTDHMLFIAAGAFHASKPADLIPELQGRFPIRVELRPLGARELLAVLTEPENALVRQYTALLATEGVRLEFTPEGCAAIADIAARVNETTEDIGARRLHTVMEKLLEDLAFAAPDDAPPEVCVDAAYVRQRLEHLAADRDLSQFIL